jgi:hypothetical protein
LPSAGTERHGRGEHRPRVTALVRDRCGVFPFAQRPDVDRAAAARIALSETTPPTPTCRWTAPQTTRGRARDAASPSADTSRRFRGASAFHQGGTVNWRDIGPVANRVLLPAWTVIHVERVDVGTRKSSAADTAKAVSRHVQRGLSVTAAHVHGPTQSLRPGDARGPRRRPCRAAAYASSTVAAPPRSGSPQPLSLSSTPNPPSHQWLRTLMPARRVECSRSDHLAIPAIDRG